MVFRRLILPLLTLVVLVSFCEVTIVRGQDVILLSPRWVDFRDPPDTLPVLSRKGTPKFPESLAKTSQVGYVITRLMLDSQGRLIFRERIGTQIAYERALEEAKIVESWKPGKREGKTVNTRVEYGNIFNPASATEGLADSTPRLLEVDLAWIERPADLPKDETLSPQVVEADITVAIDGSIIAIRNVSEALLRPLKMSAKNWKFAPARKAGQPIESEIRVPFILVEASRRMMGSSKEAAVPPRVTSQSKPVYPRAMHESGLRGEVVVAFIVDIEGRTRDVRVLRSLNPSFEDAAIEAVMKWRFEPGRLGDRLVNTQMQVPIIFTIEGLPEGGSGPFVQRKKKPDFSKLPKEFHYDVPPRPLHTVQPIYPYEHIAGNVEGKASVAFVIDETGRVIRADVLSASHPEFGMSVRAAVENFVFEPATQNGRPCPSLSGYEEVFESKGDRMLVTWEERELLRRQKSRPESIVKLSELDEPLRPISRKSIVYPISAKVDTGEAIIEFFVDEDGRARLPRIISATEPSFGYSAMQSLRDWRFTPPTRGGRPVVVRTQIPIRFNRK
ncbi:MAG TPA: TonB family protein [Opitutaceae bacterium]|nr:TonB family protein [Opitutaceae bacterium]